MPAITSIRKPFRIHASPFGSAAAERLLGLPALNDIYVRVGQRTTDQSFVERALTEIGVQLRINPSDLQHIPAMGPLVVVSNHPFGGVDGLALAALVQRVRPDVKLVANKLLAPIAELRDMMLTVDAFGNSERENFGTMREAVKWVKSGGALCIFPAGEVSHLNVKTRRVNDSRWNTAAARIARMTGAAVVPVFIEGRNSAIFQIAGLIHPRLRTALLPRELLKRRNTPIVAHIGSVIRPQRLAKFADPRDASDYLRLRSYVLMGREAGDAKTLRRRTRQALEPIAAAQDPLQLASEVCGLQPLAEAKDYQVFVATAQAVPHVLAEIGRLREATFRLVGEGTGRSSDIDQFDQHYLHLFIWNRARSELIGAYRLGLTDAILPVQGVVGLYTSTLFHFRKPLLEQINPAIELGRSFVRVEYQKEYLPLMLLWKGIGRFVARHPRYRNLIGSVSISSDYASLTRQILMSFLECNASLKSLARLIVPRNPPSFGPPRDAADAVAARAVESIEEVDELVAEIEQDRRRVPVLLRQYLKLGAKLLGFNVDPDFGDVLDGLMLVDLLKVEPAILGRYLGNENLAAFYAHHNKS